MASFGLAQQAPLQYQSPTPTGFSTFASITPTPSFALGDGPYSYDQSEWKPHDVLGGSCDPNIAPAYLVTSDDDNEELIHMPPWTDTALASKSRPTFFAFVKSLLSYLAEPFVSGLNTGDDSEVQCRTESDPFLEASGLVTSFEDEYELQEIPQYVLDHAPLVHLYSEEQFWPCDMADHLEHVKPYLGWKPIDADRNRYNLENLDELDNYGRKLFLTSDDNVEDRPEWLGGETNIPEEPEPDKHGKKGKDPTGGRSDAPVAVIVVEKEDGIVDAFYHFFYCYNLGNKVLNIRWGDHVGDWEHMVVRFQHGKPKQVFYSEHIYGDAFEYDAVEKIGKRPVGYSATGTHAMYATAATHRYVLPWGLLHDETDSGPLWDPLLNMHAYTFNLTDHGLRRSTLTPESPIEWFYFTGHWGDKAYPMSDRRQYYFAGQYHYVDGPLGPIYKNLGRHNVCINKECNVKKSLEDASRLRRWPSGEVIGKDEEQQILARYGEA